MALPLIPFAAGIAVGSLATYGATDKALHQRVAKLANAAIAQIRAGTDKVVSMVPKLGRSAKAEAEAMAEAADDGAEAVSEEAQAVVEAAVSKAKRSAAKASDAAKETAES